MNQVAKNIIENYIRNSANDPLSKNQCNNTATNLTLTTIVSGSTLFTLFSATHVFSTPDVSNTPLSKTKKLRAIPLFTPLATMSGYTFFRNSTPSSAKLTGCLAGIYDTQRTFNPEKDPFIPDQCNNTATSQLHPTLNGSSPYHSSLICNQCNNTATNITLSSHVSGAMQTRESAPSPSYVPGTGPGL